MVTQDLRFSDFRGCKQVATHACKNSSWALQVASAFPRSADKLSPCGLRIDLCVLLIRGSACAPCRHAVGSD